MPAKNPSETLHHPEHKVCSHSLQKAEGNRNESQDHGQSMGKSGDCGELNEA